MGRNTIEKKSFAVAILLIINVLLTNVVTGFEKTSIVLLPITLIEVALFVSLIPLDDFIKKFIDCMVLIGIVSLIGNVILVVMPNLLSYFPQVINSQGRSSTFLIFGMISDFSMTGAHRNQGIFWEPGAYQVFLCLGYLFELYSKRNGESRKWVCVLFLISLFSTMSTTGIIVAIALIVLTLGRRRGKASIIKMGLIIIITFYVAIKVLPLLGGFWEYTLVTKIDQVLNYQMGVSNEASSRMDSLFYVLQEFLKSPIFGIGKCGYIDLAEKIGHSMFTCTPMNWFAMYGIFWGIFIYRNLWKLFQKITGSYFETSIFLLILCISVFSEEFSTNPFFLILVFYGLSRQKISQNLTGEKNINYENSRN